MMPGQQCELHRGGHGPAHLLLHAPLAADAADMEAGLRPILPVQGGGSCRVWLWGKSVCIASVAGGVCILLWAAAQAHDRPCLPLVCSQR